MRLNRPLSIISSLLLLTVFVSSCFTGKKRNGKSENIAESLHRETFIHELEVIPSVVSFNDSVVGIIETAFVERAWTYNGGAKEDIYVPAQMFQIIIRFRNILPLNGGIDDWRIWSNPGGDIEFRPINRPIQGFVAYLDYIPTDTLTFNLRRYGDIVNGKPELIEERELFSVYPK